MTKFLQTAPVTADSPNHSPKDSPTGFVHVSPFHEDVEDDDDWDLLRMPSPMKEDSESILDILAMELDYTFSYDGQTVFHNAAKRGGSLTWDCLGRGFDINVCNLDGETPLMCAIKAGNLETVALLLDVHADINASNDWYGTCLHLAASSDTSGSITKLLLKQNPDTELVDRLGLTPLFVAVFTANDAVTRQLLQHGAKHQAKQPRGFTILHYAAMRPNHAFMSRLLDIRGPDFEAFYDLSSYNLPTDPKHDPASKRRAEIVHSLLEYGADIHASSKGFTPLHIAALTAQEPIVNALLEKGASAKGIPVICAYWGLGSDTVDQLLERGADIKATDSRRNKTALTWTAEIGCPATLEVLLQHGASVHHQDNHGSSALHYASANARVESVKLLLRSGANFNLRDSEGRTPLIRLASAGRFYLAGRWWDPTPTERNKTAILLLEAGCNPNVIDVHGNAAIHYAANNGYAGILTVIAIEGGNLEMVDGEGKTPLDYAQEIGHVDMVKVLKRRKFVGRRRRVGVSEWYYMRDEGMTDVVIN